MNRHRLRVAGSAAGSAVLTALVLELGWFLIFDYSVPAEGPALLLWNLLMAPFVYAVVLIGSRLLYTRSRFSVGFLFGGLTGLAWLMVAVWPGGIPLAWAETPVGLLWPLACAVGVAAAASRHGGASPEGAERAPILFGVVLTSMTMIGLTQAPPSWSEALAVARGAEDLAPLPPTPRAHQISFEDRRSTPIGGGTGETRTQDILVQTDPPVRGNRTVVQEVPDHRTKVVEAVVDAAFPGTTVDWDAGVVVQPDGNPEPIEIRCDAEGLFDGRRVAALSLEFPERIRPAGERPSSGAGATGGGRQTRIAWATLEAGENLWEVRSPR